MTNGWVVLPLVLLALAAVVMAVVAKRARAAADRREQSLLSRVDVLERALASSAEEPPAPEPEPEPAPIATGGGGAKGGGDEPAEEGDTEVPDSLTDPLTGLSNESFFRVTLD